MEFGTEKGRNLFQTAVYLETKETRRANKETSSTNSHMIQPAVDLETLGRTISCPFKLLPVPFKGPRSDAAIVISLKLSGLKLYSGLHACMHDLR